MILALLVLLPIPVMGWLVVRLLMGRAESVAAIVTQLALGWGVGAGICALNYYLWLRIDAYSGAGFLVGETVLLGVLAGILGCVVYMKRRRAEVVVAPHLANAATPRARASLSTWILTALLVLAAFASWRQFASALEASPHGSYDAFSVYNLKARLMYRGGEDWQHAMSAVNPHPDYPLLLPALVARSWSLLGVDLQVVPQLVAFLYLAATALLLIAALTRHATLATGLLAGSVLLATPFFAIHAASLFADGPLTWAFLGVLVLVSTYGTRRARAPNALVLAGLVAAIAAWTKNEGVLFAGAAGVALCIVKLGTTTRSRALGWFAFGAAPLLLLLLHFKLTAPPTTTGLAPLSRELVARLVSPGRYWVVIQAVAFHSWVVFPALVIGMYAWMNGMRREPATRRVLLLCGVTLGVTLLGYLFAYVVASGDLGSMVSRSSRRLLLQVWPVALWMVFIGTRPLFERTTAARSNDVPEAELDLAPEVRSVTC